MASKKRGLGKGIDSLIPLNTGTGVKEAVKEKSSVVKKINGQMNVKISEVEPNRNQPRKTFDENGINELSESIKQHGIVEPLIVVKKEDYYQIVAGERRWRAAMKAGLKEIPVVVKDYSDEQIVEIALIENLQREDLNPIEEARAYRQLINEYNLKQDDVAKKVSKSRVTVTNSLRLLKLDEQVQEMLMADIISSGHARALLSLDDKTQQLEVANMIVERELTVRDTEKLIKQLKNGENEKKAKKKLDNSSLFADYEENLKQKMGSKVIINRKNNTKGKIEIEYYSNEEFERIYSILMK